MADRINLNRFKDNNFPPVSRRNFLKMIVATCFAARVDFKSLSSSGRLNEAGEKNEKFDLIYENPDFRAKLNIGGQKIILVPLQPDYFYDDNKPFDFAAPQEESQSVIPSDVWGLWSFQENKGGSLNFSVLPHLTGGKYLPIIYWEGGINKDEVLTGQDLLGIYSYSARGEIYPNKIINILTSLGKICQYQEKNGCFNSGKPYSLLNILENFSEGYVLGKNSKGDLVKGGGVCAVASTLAKSLLLAKATFKEKWLHPWFSTYFVPPTDANINIANSDATIRLDKDDKKFDLVWEPSQDSYISISAQLLYGQNDEGDFDSSTTRIFFTIAQTTKPPLNEHTRLTAILEKFKNSRKYRASMGTTIEQNPDFFQSLNTNSPIVQEIYPEERRKRFEDEIKNDPLISDIFSLSNLLGEYQKLYPSKDTPDFVGAGGYLKMSSWYKEKVQKMSKEELKKLNSALTNLEGRTYYVPNQAVQCIGWVCLLSSIGEKGCPKNIGGKDISFASELVPDKIKNASASGNDSFLDEDLIYLFGGELPIEKVQIGDLFVIYNTSFGHIGAVVGKKTVDGEVVLLISDANRKNDGKVKIFEVDKINYDVIFGSKPYKKVLIR